MRRIQLLIIFILFNIFAVSCQMPDGYNDNIYTDPDFTTYRNNYYVMDKGPVKGGTLRLFSTYPDTLNPLMTNNAYVQSFCNLIFESLVKIGKDQKPVPLLSESWNVSDNGLIWTFKLRQNVFWHDNVHFTAEDVEFTFELILNSSIETVYKKNLQNVATFAAIDRNTFRLVLRKPNSFTAEMLTFPIIPKHYFNTGDISRLLNNVKPVGTGPFKFESYTEKKSIRLTANENWWNARNSDESLPDFPYINTIEIKLYESSKNEMGTFQTRDIDLTCIENTDYKRYSERSDLLIKKYLGRNFEFIALNLSRPVLKEIPVRQAISLALDRQKLIESILPGKAVEADMPVLPGSWLYDTGNTSFAHDRKKAREILQENGWKEEKGVMHKSINRVKTTLELEILVNEDNMMREEIAQNISLQLKEIGINAKVTKLGWDEEFKRIDSGKFDMAVIGCRIPTVPDISFLYSDSYLPSFVNQESGARNISGYFNQDLSDYIDRFYSEHDYERKKAIFLNMRNIISEEVPYIGLFFLNNAILCNTNVRGEMEPHVWDRYNNIAMWYMPNN